MITSFIRTGAGIVVLCVALSIAFNCLSEENPNNFTQQLPDDIVLGQDSAKVTIIEYSSLGCPSCAHFHTEVLPEIEQKYINTGKVKLIFRNYPLHPEDIKAAAIALCADKKDYYTFLRALFVTQKNWARESSNIAETLEHIGKIGRISGTQIKTCLEDKNLEDKIIKSRQIAQTAMKISATPTLIINGQIYGGSPSKKRLSKLIDDALNNS